MLRKTVTRYGAIEGFACGDPRITAFLGVPYAKPPVGELRWKDPQPPEPWQGTYKADKFGPISLQGQPGVDRSGFYTLEFNSTAYEYKMSEDCLYLNIYTPARSAEDRYPVLFYIHGGGYCAGYAYETEFDGERIARNGVVFVSVGYRLGALGFFAHRELNNPSQGNFGMMDVLQALKWVNENIAAFGGDPDQVVIAGQSAGGGAVNAQTISPLAKGLFKGGIMMSGGGLRPPVEGFRNFRSLDKAFDDGELFLKQLRVNSLEEAMMLPGEVIAATGLARWPGGGRAPWTPTVDGYFLLEESQTAILNGNVNDVAVMIGCCRGEASYDPFFNPYLESREKYESYVRRSYPKIADRLLSMVDMSSEEAFCKFARNEFTMGAMFPGRIAYAARMSRLGRKVYTYLFDHDIPGDDNPGSFHGSDMMFTFDSLGHSWRPYEGKHYDLARQVSSYWANFVKTCDPNGTDRIGEPLPEWRPYTEEDPFTICFKDKPEELKDGNREILDVMVRYTLEEI